MNLKSMNLAYQLQFTTKEFLQLNNIKPQEKIAHNKNQHLCKTPDIPALPLLSSNKTKQCCTPEFIRPPGLKGALLHPKKNALLFSTQ